MSQSLHVLILRALAVPLLWIWSHGSSNEGVLARYLAELRVKDDKLTWAELGCPRVPEVSDRLQKVLAAWIRLVPEKQTPASSVSCRMSARGVQKPAGNLWSGKDAVRPGGAKL